MKVQPADFFVKHPSRVIAALCFITTLAQAQNYAPGAVQAPAYRQSGSAYPAPAQPRATTPPPAAPKGYQPGYGTPPPSYKPPALKSPAPSKSTKSSTSSKPVTLETKVARLEKNDARQDSRLNSLERGTGTGSGSSPAPSEGKFYTVRPGDTLWRIADRHSTSINAIKSANRLTGEIITIGQTLVIPGHSPVHAPSAPSDVAGVHIVRPGDTFSEIAHANGISQDALARANPSAYPDRLLIGERLTIPGKKASSSPSWSPPPSSSTATMSSRAHIVKKGESLGVIAKGYGIPTATLASANNLKNANLIEPGQRLIIPSGAAPRSTPATSVPTYPSFDSDTQPLPGASVASYTYAPPAPAPVVAPEPAPVSRPSTPVSSNRRGIVAYRLERGDDINTVSNLFNTTPDKIRELNKLSPDSKLKEGDEVVVPSIGAVSLN